MYRDDNNRRVKIVTAGKPYPVGADGWRTGKASGRPAGVDPEVWSALRPILKKEGKTYEQFLQKYQPKSLTMPLRSLVQLWILDLLQLPSQLSRSSQDPHASLLPAKKPV
jgi:hypothetical protein